MSQGLIEQYNSRVFAEHPELNVDRLDNKTVANGRVGIRRQTTTVRAVEVNAIIAEADMHAPLGGRLRAEGRHSSMW